MLISADHLPVDEDDVDDWVYNLSPKLKLLNRRLILKG